MTPISNKLIGGGVATKMFCLEFCLTNYLVGGHLFGTQEYINHFQAPQATELTSFPEKISGGIIGH